MDELEALFGRVLATGSKNWSSKGVIAFGVKESSIHSKFMPSETLINLKEDENLSRNSNDEVQGFMKKTKERKERANLRRN